MYNYGKFLILSIFSLIGISGLAQEISIHPKAKIDTVWYSNVTEDSEPEQLSCEENGIGYYRLKFTSEIVVDEIKKDTIKTKKEDWEKEDEEAFDEKYNEEKKEELEELEEEFIEEDVDIATQAQEEIDRYIEVNWNGYRYNICDPDCESVVQQCYIYHEITQLKDYKKTYKYRTSYSWVEIKDEGDNEVELEFDLVITYEAWIYFFVVCSCNDIPDLMSVPSKQLNEGNPWAHIDVLGEMMKPGYPFVIDSKSFPVLPVAGGIIGGGGLVYLLTKDGGSESCNFTSSFQVTNTTCGDQSGRAEVVLNPPGDYIYKWSSGQSSSSINNVEAGNYSVTVTPSDQDCPKTINVVIGDDNEIITNDVATTNSDCGKNNGTATIENPSVDQNYSWSDGSTGNMISGLGAGEYAVTITKGNCSNSLVFTIFENEALFEVTDEIVHPTCGQSDGSITTAVSPQGEYQYQWSNGASGSTLSALKQGSYTVTITELGNDCSVIESFSLEDLPADYNLTFTSSDATCGVSDGSISLDVDVPGSYSYLWSNGETSESLTDQPAGEYSVTVTLMDSDCSVSGSATIGEKPFPLEIDFINSNPNCGLSDGEIILQLTPEGSYTFEWSNGQTEQNISGLSKGEYAVTISDQNGCTATGSALLEDVPSIYIEQVNTTPGDCIHTGEITLTITTPGDGPIVTNINGPNIQETFLLNAGTHDLSTLSELPPGKYSIEVYDQNAGVECKQMIEVVVDDNTPDLLAENDNYEIEAGETATGNVLNNDQGLNIFVNDFFDVVGGTASVNSDGMFQFVPDDDFAGEASFEYVIEDACADLDTAWVIIIVKNVDCTFITQFEIIAATCGLEDGHAFAFVEPSGNYEYLWSTGETSSELSPVFSGTYGLFITDTDLGCVLIYEVFVPENEPSYVSNLIVFQPSCSSEGEIQFDLGNTPGPFLATISHPGGIDAFVIPAGTVLLSDYIPIVTGDYTISVYDSNAGPECSETFSATVEESEGFIITVIEIISPSSASANDGAVIIEVTSPGMPPYNIWVNGDIWDITTENEFIVGELGVGEYSIYLTDVDGCISNVVEVFVPPPMVAPIKVGVGIFAHLNAAQESLQSGKMITSLFFVELSHDYKFIGTNNTSALRYINYNKEPHFYLSNLVELKSFKLGEIGFSLKGGIMLNYQKGQFEDPGLVSELSGRINLIPLSIDLFISNSNGSSLPLNIGLRLKY